MQCLQNSVRKNEPPSLCTHNTRIYRHSIYLQNNTLTGTHMRRNQAKTYTLHKIQKSTMRHTTTAYATLHERTHIKSPNEISNDWEHAAPCTCRWRTQNRSLWCLRPLHVLSPIYFVYSRGFLPMP